MNQKQENILSMWGAVNDILTANEAIWNTIGECANTVALFRDIRANFAPEAKKQESLSKGSAASKAQLRINVTGTALQMAANLQVFARRTGNKELEANVALAFSDLNRLRDQELPVKVRNILDAAGKYLGELKDYAINENSITTLKTILDQYEAARSAPRSAISSRKTSTANIAALIRQGNEELDNLDLLMGNFAISHPVFVSDYRNARLVVDNKGRGGRKDEDKKE